MHDLPIPARLDQMAQAGDDGEEVMLTVRLKCRPTIETEVCVLWSDWHKRPDEAALQSLKALLYDSVDGIDVDVRVDTIDILELTPESEDERRELQAMLDGGDA